MFRFTLLGLLASCWTAGSQTTTQTKPPVDPDVRVVLAAVTLGDDCGDIAMRASNRKPAAPADAPAEAGPGAAPRVYRPACEQTSMQLAVRSTGGESPTTIRVKKVELLDNHGAVLAELASRSPTRWSDDGYVTWDQTVAPNQTLQASYALSAPDWNTLTGSRWNAHSKTFQLRVTLAVGSKNRTVEKQSITPAMLEPPVPT